MRANLHLETFLLREGWLLPEEAQQPATFLLVELSVEGGGLTLYYLTLKRAVSLSEKKSWMAAVFLSQSTFSV